MWPLMNMGEAKETCQDRSMWTKVESAYPYDKEP